jgi:plasmid stabilization system protein ParE
MAKFQLHPEAKVDLKEIHAYIASRSPDAARNVILAIRESIRALVPFPQQGHRRPDLTGRPLRFISVFDYLIAYSPHESPLWVVAILRGDRDPRVIAAILRSRESVPDFPH